MYKETGVPQKTDSKSLIYYIELRRSGEPRAENRSSLSRSRKARKVEVEETRGEKEGERESSKAAAASGLKRQYRRKLIIGVRRSLLLLRGEQNTGASSDCCFQLNLRHALARARFT